MEYHLFRKDHAYMFDVVFKIDLAALLKTKRFIKPL